LLLSDAPGLILEGAVVPQLDPDALAAALDHADVRAACAPSLSLRAPPRGRRAARAAHRGMVGPGTLAGILASGGGGTTLSAVANPFAAPHAAMPGATGGAGAPGHAAHQPRSTT
jgi:hypothetical protein